MKLMTFNLLNGAEDRLPLVIKIIKQEAPDYLTLNETNTFATNDNQLLKDLARETSFPNFDLALSGEDDYHVAVLSKTPFKKIDHITPLDRAGILTVVNSPFGELAIAGTHLTPYSEKERLPEINLILKALTKYRHKVIMGDMNSLSPDDSYDPKIVENFNEMQIKKFTSGGKLRFDVIEKILAANFLDPAVKLRKNKIFTAPTASINEFNAHSNMRLDYIFVSETLAAHLKSYEVVKNEFTDQASDHYPVAIALE